MEELASIPDLVAPARFDHKDILLVGHVWKIPARKMLSALLYTVCMTTDRGKGCPGVSSKAKGSEVQ